VAEGDDRAVFRPPVLEIDLCAVFGGNRVHNILYAVGEKPENECGRKLRSRDSKLLSRKACAGCANVPERGSATRSSCASRDALECARRLELPTPLRLTEPRSFGFGFAPKGL
jgi:hypothetical protein